MKSEYFSFLELNKIIGQNLFINSKIIKKFIKTQIEEASLIEVKKCFGVFPLIACSFRNDYFIVSITVKNSEHGHKNDILEEIKKLILEKIRIYFGVSKIKISFIIKR